MSPRKEIMEEEIVCNRERDLADERITITNIKISSSSFVISFLGGGTNLHFTDAT
jgi:hypothetical protein